MSWTMPMSKDIWKGMMIQPYHLPHKINFKMRRDKWVFSGCIDEAAARVFFFFCTKNELHERRSNISRTATDQDTSEIVDI
mmetsp:Transcript_22031/g.45921  ORF Transcript_22031/g.45921 Transcript_22031/m.45921 type:complete len:81 (-) Transcript_22031:47-289(-)